MVLLRILQNVIKTVLLDLPPLVRRTCCLRGYGRT